MINSKKIKQDGVLYKTLILWFAILVLASFAVSLQAMDDTVGIKVAPAVLREGEPVVVTFFINNPTEQAAGTDYTLYANGKPLMSGTTELSPGAGKQFQYVYSNPLKLGEQVTFSAITQSGDEVNQNTVAVPSTPPELWSSFVSFAAFSTSAISSMSMSSMAYYDQSFGTNRALNAGLIFSIVLIILLIYMELSEPLLANKEMRIIGNLRIRARRLSSVLFIIFLAMVFTQIAVIIGGVR